MLYLVSFVVVLAVWLSIICTIIGDWVIETGRHLHQLSIMAVWAAISTPISLLYDFKKKHFSKRKENSKVTNDRGQNCFQRHLLDSLKPASSILNTKTNTFGELACHINIFTCQARKKMHRSKNKSICLKNQRLLGCLLSSFFSSYIQGVPPVPFHITK